MKEESEMKYETIEVEKHEEYVASLKLNRPEKLNTFSRQRAEELNSALKEMDEETGNSICPRYSSR